MGGGSVGTELILTLTLTAEAGRVSGQRGARWRGRGRELGRRGLALGRGRGRED